jgi:hypothetical protein
MPPNKIIWKHTFGLATQNASPLINKKGDDLKIAAELEVMVYLRFKNEFFRVLKEHNFFCRNLMLICFYYVTWFKYGHQYCWHLVRIFWNYTKIVSLEASPWYLTIISVKLWPFELVGWKKQTPALFKILSVQCSSGFLCGDKSSKIIQLSTERQQRGNGACTLLRWR